MAENEALLVSQNGEKSLQNERTFSPNIENFDDFPNIPLNREEFDDDSSSEGGQSDRDRLLQPSDSLKIIDRSSPTVIHRRVGLIHAVALLVGQIIGSGIFISPTIALKNSGSLGFTLIIWTFGGVLSLMGAMCFCELGTMIEKSGGDYVYLKIAYGKLAAFLYSWLNVWVLDPASFAIKSMTFSLYLNAAFKTGCNEILTLKLFAAISIIFFAALNCISVSLAAKSQVLFTGAKLIGIFTIIVIGAVQIFRGEMQNFHDIFQNTTTNPGMVGHALYAVMWSYAGWNNLNLITEELKNPEKNFNRCMYISIPLVTLCYVLINISYFAVLSTSEMLASNAVAFTFADKLNPIFGFIMPLIVATSCFGSINSQVFGASRGLFSISREGQLPKLFSFVHRETQTPLPAIILRAVLGLLMLLPATIEPLINCLQFIEWIVLCLMFLTVILLRWRKPHLKRPYKVPLIIPILLIPVALYFICTPFISKPIESVMGLVLITAGIPVYYVFLVKKWIPKKIIRCLGYSTYMSALLCNVVEPMTPKSFGHY